jgi:hypothetical protein
MSMRRVDEQPLPLQGHEYGPADWEWYEFFTERDGVYAVVGMAVTEENLWMYWRILSPSISAWRDLRREIVPACRQLARERGCKRVIVQTSDPADTHFDKMVAFMDFNQSAFVKRAWQEV